MATVDLTGDRSRIKPVDYGERSAGNWIARRFVHTDFVTTGDTVSLITIPANSFVAHVFLHIEEAFAGGTVTLKVGDDTQAEGYLLNTDIGAATAGNVVNTVADMHSPDATGVYALVTARPFYTSADTIDVDLAFNSATTAGIGVLIAEIVTIP